MKFSLNSRHLVWHDSEPTKQVQVLLKIMLRNSANHLRENDNQHIYVTKKLIRNVDCKTLIARANAAEQVHSTIQCVGFQLATKLGAFFWNKPNANVRTVVDICKKRGTFPNHNLLGTEGFPFTKDFSPFTKNSSIYNDNKTPLSYPFSSIYI